MKKIITILICAFLLVGCGSAGNIYVLKDSTGEYFLVNTDGEQINEIHYNEVIAVENKGYILIDEGQYGFINVTGKEIIPLGTYESIDNRAGLLVAKSGNTTSLIGVDGKVYYQDDDSTVITVTAGYPIVKTGEEWHLIGASGKPLVTSKQEIIYSQMDKSGYLVGYNDKAEYYNGDSKPIVISGSSDVTLLETNNEVGTLLYSEDVKTLTFVTGGVSMFEIAVELPAKDSGLNRAYFDEGKNIIANIDGVNHLINQDGDIVTTLNSYYIDASNYTNKNSVNIYGPHEFVSNQNTIEVSDIQLDPKAGYSISEIFPVFVRNKGYAYYSFEGIQVFETVYKRASTFDAVGIAIVSSEEDKYYLIDTTGTKLSEDFMAIEPIGDGYYAAYHSTYRYEVIDKTGKKVIDEEFLHNYMLVKGEESLLGVFDLGGRTNVYNMETYELLYQIPGTVTYDEAGYFVVDGNTYYGLDGQEIFGR